MPNSGSVIDTILKHEGKYQNSSKDRGNWNSKGDQVGTNYGITPQVYEEHFGVIPTQADMKSLTEAQAREIYEKRYVDPVKRNLKIDESHPAFQQLVDMTVNHGYSGMVTMLQRATGAKVDGKAGPGTQKAMQGIDPVKLNELLVDVRIDEYNRQAKSNPDKQVWLRGWINRANSFR